MFQKIVVRCLRGVVLLLVLTIASYTQMGCGQSSDSVMGPVSNSTVVESTIEKPDAGLMNERDRRGFAWAYGDWSSRVHWEAKRALSQAANGYSNWRGGDDRYGPQWLADWDYVSSDPYARDRCIAESFKQYGTYLGTVNGHYCGGTCTWFVRLILYRATYWAGYGVHLTTPNYPNSVYSWCDNAHMTRNWSQVKPGWVGSSPQNHMLIFDQRTQVNGRWGWYVIDSNYIGGAGKEWIGKHFMPDTKLTSDNYWAWLPSWATTN